jgi:hypothetical protein
LRHTPDTHNASKRTIPHPACPSLNSLVKGKNVVSVKGGCIDGLDWKEAVHIWTKSAMVPIPEGSESHTTESSIRSDYREPQDILDQGEDGAAPPEQYDDASGLRGNGNNDQDWNAVAHD